MKRSFILMLLLLTVLLFGCDTPEENLHIQETTLSATEATQEPTVVEEEPPVLKLHVLAVDMADCLLLECSGEILLIDSGTPESSTAVMDYLNQQEIEKLDFVIASHGHRDHVGGFPEVFNKYPVGKLYSRETDYTSVEYRAFLQSLEKHELKATEPVLGEQFHLGEAVVTFLGPVATYERVNNNSIVVKVEFGSHTFLLTADMEAPAEQDMMDYWGNQFDWNADVLKAGHHGLVSSTAEPFAQSVCPQYAIVTCSAERPIHETPKHNLQQVGAKIYGTGEMGNIVVTTDGTTIDISWDNPKAVPERSIPAATMTYYGDRETKIFHMERCSNLPDHQNLKNIPTYKSGWLSGYVPCDECLGEACG